MTEHSRVDTQVNEYLSDANGYLAKQSDERKANGPSEAELKAPIGIVDKLLVLVWVGVLVAASSYITSLIPDTPPGLQMTL